MKNESNQLERILEQALAIKHHISCGDENCMTHIDKAADTIIDMIRRETLLSYGLPENRIDEALKGLFPVLGPA